MTIRWLRGAGLVLASACVAFWLWFGIASALSEKLGTMNWVMHLLVPGGLLLAALLIAWRWERLGGILFLALGLLVLIGYPVLVAGRFPWTTVVFVLLTMAVPPLAAGYLLLLDDRRRRLGDARGR